MNITLIGAGNLATRLGLALYAAGHRIEQVYSRTTGSAQMLSRQIAAEAVTDPGMIRKGADLYLCALRDDALETVLNKLSRNDSILVHTAGSMPLDVLFPYSDRTGVLYFFQSFSKQRAVDFTRIPVYVESGQEEVRQVLNELARSLGGEPRPITSEQRLKLHLSAVYACNFVNYLYSIAYDLTTGSGLDFDVLLPLIRETALKIENNIPRDVQTGPAVRQDLGVMSKHLSLLEGQPHLKKIYELLSEGIQQMK